jgi:hypothetical protein
LVLGPARTGPAPLTRLADGHGVMLFTLAGWGRRDHRSASGAARSASPAESGQSAARLGALDLGPLDGLGGGADLAATDARKLGADRRSILATLLVRRPCGGSEFRSADGSMGRGRSPRHCSVWLEQQRCRAVPITRRLGLSRERGSLGMVGSAFWRGSFRVRRIRAGAALRHGLSGVAMGAGAALIPGGNDGPILFGLPALSPHALPA